MERDDTLRLPASLRDAAERRAREGGATLDQFVVTAVAEKVSALKAADFFAERRARADLDAFDRFIDRPGGTPPTSDDLRECDDPGPARGASTVQDDRGS